MTTAKILVMSDLHNEFERGRGPRYPTKAWFSLDRARGIVKGHPAVGPLLKHLRGEKIDFVVMAGDIDLELHGVVYADSVSKFLDAPVVYVHGNHEPYSGRDMADLVPEIRAAAAATDGRVTFLENDVAVFDIRGRRIHVPGCCLFTDYYVNCDPDASEIDLERGVAKAMRDATRGLNDYRFIMLRGNRFSPDMARQIHDVSRQWLGRRIRSIRDEEGEAAVILVVTHYGPIPEANPPQYRGGAFAPAFVSDMRAEIAEWRPTAWIWGHTHYSMETTMGTTRLISSQRGYVCQEAGADEYLPKIIEI